MNQEEREEIIDALLHGFSNELVESDDVVIDITTRSNCYAWGLDDHQNLKTWHEDEDIIGFSVDLYLSGDPDEEAPSPLDGIWVKVEGEATLDNGKWEISSHKVLEAEYDLDYAEIQDYVDAVTSNINYFQTFSDEIASLKLLNTIPVSDTKALRTLQRQIYVGAITCLETFLSDAFINNVLSKDEFLESFFSHYDFKDKKIDMKSLYDYAQRVQDIAKREMLEVLYHNIPKVSEIYKAVLKVEFPKFQSVVKAVSTRHDLVHRNGKTKDGKDVDIDKDVVDTVITEVEEFVGEINRRLEKRISPELDDEDLPF
jgi:hypothetical protein